MADNVNDLNNELNKALDNLAETEESDEPIVDPYAEFKRELRLKPGKYFGHPAGVVRPGDLEVADVDGDFGQGSDFGELVDRFEDEVGLVADVRNDQPVVPTNYLSECGKFVGAG